MFQKIKIGVFFSDASFLKKGDTSTIAFFNLIDKSYKQKEINISNVLEAEKEAIKYTLIENLNFYKNIIVFSDNLQAVLFYKKNILRKKNNTIYRNYNYLDVVWIPREFNIADFFTKFANEDNLEKILKDKANNINEKEKKFDNIIKQLSNISIKTKDY